MRLLCTSIPVLFLIAGTASGAAQPADVLRELKRAAEKNDATGAGMLIMGIGKAAMGASANRNKIHELRHWEDVLAQGQAMVAKMNSPEASQAFAKAFTRMPPHGQALLAMGLRSHPATPELIQTCIRTLSNARDLQVQVACMDLLAAFKADEGVDAILKHLKERNLVSIQIAACRALARIGDPKAVQPLIEYLAKWRGSRMRYEANAALRAISGVKFNADPSTWAGWWEKNKDTFERPSGIEPEFNYELEVEPEEGEEKITYYEIPIIENRVVFLIDISGSMQAGEPNRLERARTELKSLINRLDPNTRFNIVLFNNKIERWSPQALMPATPVNKKGACYWLDKAEPAGGTSTMEATEEALYEIALMNGVETIFLLTDGLPQPMRHSGVRNLNQLPRGNADIRRRIRFINQTLKVRINTIGVYTAAQGRTGNRKVMEEFLKGVADENDGVYKVVD